MILLVDDDLYALGSYIRAIEGAGLEVTCRSGAEEGLAAFSEDAAQWECAIIDMMMPVPSGWDDDQGEELTTGLTVAKRIRSVRADLPIIFLTNIRDASVLQDVENFPGAKYLDKRELKAKDFVAKIHEMVRGSKSTEGSETA
ncbi:MAG: response regulator [Bryobacterales bacterium]|nr:response regulator [Bryobacterales bacterium]